MLNTALFTSGSAVFLFVRDRPGRACQGNSFRGRGKNTFVGSFIRPPPKTISMSPVAVWRVVWWTSLGAEGGGKREPRKGVACPVSRAGIARDISSPQEVSSAPTNDHRRLPPPTPPPPPFATARSYPSFPINPRVAFVSSGSATFKQMKR